MPVVISLMIVAWSVMTAWAASELVGVYIESTRQPTTCQSLRSV